MALLSLAHLFCFPLCFNQIAAFESFAEEFGISLTLASYTVSVPILFLGTFP